MAESEESDKIGLNIALEPSKKQQEELSDSLKENGSHPTPHAAMTTGMTATDASTAQEGPDYGVHDYYKYDESISTNEYRRRRLILQV